MNLNIFRKYFVLVTLVFETFVIYFCEVIVLEKCQTKLILKRRFTCQFLFFSIFLHFTASVINVDFQMCIRHKSFLCTKLTWHFNSDLTPSFQPFVFDPRKSIFINALESMSSPKRDQSKILDIAKIVTPVTK